MIFCTQNEVQTLAKTFAELKNIEEHITRALSFSDRCMLAGWWFTITAHQTNANLVNCLVWFGQHLMKDCRTNVSNAYLSECNPTVWNTVVHSETCTYCCFTMIFDTDKHGGSSIRSNFVLGNQRISTTSLQEGLQDYFKRNNSSTWREG